MARNDPQQLTAAEITRTITTSLLTRLVCRVSRFVCGLRGHDSVLHFEGRRVMMRCTSCGHDSPGWEIGGRGPRLRYEGDARRHLLAPQRLVLRKTA